MKRLLYLGIGGTIVLSLVYFGTCFTYLHDLKLNLQLNHCVDNPKDNPKKSIPTKVPPIQQVSYPTNIDQVSYPNIDIDNTDKVDDEINKSKIPPRDNKKAYIAIILDDVGYVFNERIKKFIQLGYKVDLSIIPGTPFCREIANMAKKYGLGVMLHMPMESYKWNGSAYKYKITSDMTEEEISNNIAGALSSIGATVEAVNNHMGSKATEDRGIMYPFLIELAKRGLIFVDSLTTPNSVIYKTSKYINIPILRRDVFLDNIADISYTKKQLRLLITQAKKKGYAIGIGHITKETTIKAIEEMYPHFKKMNVELVGVSYLLNVIGKS